jgi:hypothetical protein
VLTTRRTLARDLTTIGWIAALIMAILTAGWVVSLGLVSGPPVDADPAAKLAYLADHPEAGLVGPSLVAALALLHVPVWLGLAAVAWSRRPAAALLAVAFGLVYAPLASINYWSQLTVVRGLADLSRTDPAAATAVYRLFEFPGGLASFAYGVDVLAYVVWGVAALFAAAALAAVEGRAAKVTAVLFGAGGVLAIGGGIGFVGQVDALELGVMLSGVVFLFGLVAGAVLMRGASTTDLPVAGVSFEVHLPARP